jgi:hypothetical protein
MLSLAGRNLPMITPPNSYNSHSACSKDYTVHSRILGTLGYNGVFPYRLDTAAVQFRNIIFSVSENFFLVFCQNMTFILQLLK